ncbi:Similar to S.cerevisiae protein BAS1 (Myb-related transcription factor) [Malassezia sympodialis ATCC 42132]|uniref:Similar to S.cerevisiae protein BAS1 (Myb-related transcription factor) n=1 Tax=Malassezia sympodialis (strain ATCC 42132) TaxID=1230383 RepID=A0A1M8AA14_MALS4|nr:Similar to S.cerevisiae protein BAS1 (Myb-related transcription factor) [Malassezia sympodialis ATCC 42132]
MAPRPSAQSLYVDRRNWTPEEDALLIQAMSRFRFMQETRWTEVAGSIPGRTAKACRKRWVNGLNDRLKKGSWTSDEDARLREGVALLSNDWARIAEHVGQRSGDQCSKRWREVLDPAINKTCWTPEEDHMLIKLFEKHGSCWQEISTHFNNRRALQCRNRCCKLLGLHSHQRVKKTGLALPAASTPVPYIANNHEMPKVVSSMTDMKLPMDTNWQNQTVTSPIMMSTPTDTPLTAGVMPQMFELNGMNLSNNQVNMDYLNSDEKNTTHFLDAWNKVQGFSSTERKGTPASLSLSETEPPMGSQMTSPSVSTYSPTADLTLLPNSGSGASSLDGSPSTPFTAPTALQSNNTSTGLNQNFYPGTSMDVPDALFLSSPSLTVPSVNLDDSFKVPSAQPLMTGMVQLPTSIQELDIWTASNFLM